MSDVTLCPKCYGVLSITYDNPAVQFAVDDNGKAPEIRTSRMTYRVCLGHPEPTPEHDGKLDKKAYGTVEKIEDAYSFEKRDYIPGIRIQSHYRIGITDTVDITAVQALSLLSWLKQEEEELQELAKLEETEE